MQDDQGPEEIVPGPDEGEDADDAEGRAHQRQENAVEHADFEAPSMRAASISSSGTDSRYWRMRKMLKAFTIPGTMMAR